MGAADVIPGVSGGTMAFILGIYQRLLEAIRAFDLRLLVLLKEGRFRDSIRHTDLVFLAALLVGIFSAIGFFTRVVSLPELIRTDPELIYGLFFGLVLASIQVLLKEVSHLGSDGLLVLLLGTGAGLAIVNLVPTDTPTDSWFIFLSGSLAICAMILPGISGSFILLILRKYAYVFDAVGHLNFAVILPFALGAVTGLMLFSRFLVWLLHHHLRLTLLFITGLLTGSLWMIWPFQQRVFEIVRDKERLLHSSPIWPEAWGANQWLAVVMMVFGVLLVLVLTHLASRRH